MNEWKQMLTKKTLQLSKIQYWIVQLNNLYRGMHLN